ncbi:MAG: hypothetical protein QXX08_00695 [Candidatus Bathyarchaeia archaeon]
MAVITLRIPEELKHKMKKRSQVNWSEFVREAIRKKIEVEERLEAAKKMDEIKRRMNPVDKGQIDKWLREDRAR